MAERFVLHRNVMIKHNQFHIILQHIHHFFQVIRIMQWKSQQDIVPVKLRLLHSGYIEQLWQLKGDKRHKVFQKVS